MYACCQPAKSAQLNLGGYPDYYIIQYSQQNHSVETVQVVAPYHTITGLHPLSHYTVKVASHNYNGMSDFSQDSTFGTFGMSSKKCDQKLFYEAPGQVTVEGPTEGLSGEPLSLHCMVESIPASPSPLFVWSRDGGSLPATSIIINGEDCLLWLNWTAALYRYVKLPRANSCRHWCVCMFRCWCSSATFGLNLFKAKLFHNWYVRGYNTRR